MGAMEYRFGDYGGGMIGLQEFIKEYRESLEATLIQAGLRLRDIPCKHTDWRDLLLFIKHVGEDTPLYRAVNQIQDGQWQPADYLLASILDNLNWLVWAKTKDGVNNRNRPKPVPRPGDEKKKNTIGTAKPLEELVSILPGFWREE